MGLDERQLHIGERGGEDLVGVGELAQSFRCQAGAFRPLGETVPARQHEAGLRPGEDPGDGAQILDPATGDARGGAAADVQLGDLGDGCGRPEEVPEPRVAIDPVAIGLRAGLAEPPHLQVEPSVARSWGVDVVIGEKSYEYRFNEIRRDENHTRYGLFAEYRPAPAWNIRIHADNVTSGKAERRREQYAGPRGAAALKRIETRSLDFGPSAGITVQRSFGR